MSKYPKLKLIKYTECSKMYDINLLCVCAYVIDLFVYFDEYYTRAKSLCHKFLNIFKNYQFLSRNKFLWHSMNLAK